MAEKSLSQAFPASDIGVRNKSAMRIILQSFILICFVFTPAVYVEATNGSVPEICKIDNFIACLNITKAKCVFSDIQSKKNCSEKYPIELLQEKENEELNELLEKYSSCVMNDLVDLMGVQIDKFNTCSVHLESFLSEQKEKARKEQERLNDEFFNTD